MISYHCAKVNLRLSLFRERRPSLQYNTKPIYFLLQDFQDNQSTNNAHIGVMSAHTVRDVMVDITDSRSDKQLSYHDDLLPVVFHDEEGAR